MRKRGQVTLFIIVGIVILLIGLIFAYNNFNSSKEIIPESYKNEKIAAEFNPIKTYIDNCIYKTSIEALTLAGQHGGYVSMDNNKINYEVFSQGKEPTESDAVVFSPGSRLSIPYWYYLESKNDCEGTCSFSSKRPDLTETDNSIEKQIERYVDNNLKACLNDFSAFKKTGIEIIEKGKIKTDVVIAKEEMVVLVDYPIDVSIDKKASISKYYARVPVNLKNIYSLASKLTDMQNEYRFFEKALINIIASFSEINKDKLPPVSDLKFGVGSEVTWSKRDIKEKIMSILSSYVSLFQVDGTYNYNRNMFSGTLKQRIYDAFIVPVIDGDYSDYSVSFSYLDFWPIYFDLNCNGDNCEPESGNSPLLDMVGIQRYNFMYDVSYPVLIEINEPGALNGRGYSFKFFIESNIRNNEPMPVEFKPLRVKTESKRTSLCDLEQRQSEEVALIIHNSATKEKIKEARISYTVGDETCFIGSTNENGSLVARFPTGTIGGMITVSKTDYIEKSELFDAGGKLSIHYVELEPILEKELIIKKKNLVKKSGSWQLSDSALDISESEEAFIYLERLSDVSQGKFSSVSSYIINSPEKNMIRIAPGEYKLSINLISSEELIIPKKEVHEDGGPLGEDVDYTLPEVRFGKDKPYNSGGVSLNISVSNNDIINSNKALFYVLSADIKGISQSQRQLDDIDVMNNYDSYSGKYKDYLKPEFKR